MPSSMVLLPLLMSCNHGHYLSFIGNLGSTGSTVMLPVSTSMLLASHTFFHNHSVTCPCQGDSSTSISSMAQSYAICGVSEGRAAWTKHHPDLSTNLVFSNYICIILLLICITHS